MTDFSFFFTTISTLLPLKTVPVVLMTPFASYLQLFPTQPSAADDYTLLKFITTIVSSQTVFVSSSKLQALDFTGVNWARAVLRQSDCGLCWCCSVWHNVNYLLITRTGSVRCLESQPHSSPPQPSPQVTTISQHNQQPLTSNFHSLTTKGKCTHILLRTPATATWSLHLLSSCTVSQDS